MNIDLDGSPKHPVVIPMAGPSAAHDAKNALGYSTLRQPNVNMVPMVVEANYPGLSSYHESGASLHNTPNQPNGLRTDAAPSESVSSGPWNYLKNAWNASNKSPGQIIIVVFSVLLVLLVLFLIIGAFALFAKRSRNLVNRSMTSADRYVHQMQYKYAEPVTQSAAQSSPFSTSNASSHSLWTRRYQ